MAQTLTRYPQVRDLTLTTEKIADLAIATNEVANAAVTTQKIADNSVTTSKLTTLDTIDSNTVALLHMNNNAIDSSSSAKSVTNNNVTFSNSVSKFGGYSALFNGSNSSLVIPASTDFDFGTDDFTIDYWINFTAVNTQSYHFTQYAAPKVFSCVTDLRPAAGSKIIQIYASNNWSGGPHVMNYYAYWTPTVSTWYHIAFVRSGSNFNLYINGVAQTLLTGTVIGNNSMPSTGAAFNIGRWPGDAVVPGYIDEFRISKGIARWTSAFTPAINAYGDNAIHSNKLANNAVITSKILDSAVTTSKLSNLNVLTSKFADLNVTTSKIADSNVTTSKLVSAIDPSTNLLLHLDGNCSDSSKNGIIVNNYGATYSLTRKIGTFSALFTDGASIAASGNSIFDVGSSNFTIECWVNFNSISERNSVIYNKGASSSWYSLYYDTRTVTDVSLRNQIAFEARNAGVQVCRYTAAFVPNLGQWYHVAVVRNGTSMAIYIDGVSKTLNNIIAVGSTAFNATSSDPFIVGNYGIGYSSSGPGYTTGSVLGYIDEFRFSNNVRYSSNFTPSTVSFGDNVNSIQTSRLANSSITTRKIANNAITTDTIIDSGITTAKLASSDYTIDSYTKLLIHFNNSLGDASGNGKSMWWGPSGASFGGGAIGYSGASFARTSDATGQYAWVLPDADWNFGTSDFTIDLWCSPNAMGSHTYPTVFRAHNINLRYTNKFEVYYNGGFVVSANTFASGAWHHVAMVKSGSTMYLYVNGTLQGSSAASLAIDASDGIEIGQDGAAIPAFGFSADANYRFLGYIDEFRISKGIARWTTDFTPNLYEYGSIPGAVISKRIANSNVITQKIADSNITTSKIANGAVITSKVTDSTITTSKIANKTVSTPKIADANVTTIKIGNGVIDSSKFKSSTITLKGILVTGNSTFKGSTVSVKAPNLVVKDNAISLGSGINTGTSAITTYNGMEVLRGTSIPAKIVFDESTDKWKVDSADSVAASFADGASHSEGSQGYVGGVRVSDTKIVLAPYNSAYVGLYNPSTNSYSRGVSHGGGTGGGLFRGSVVLPNGKVLFIPYQKTTFGIYDPSNNTYAAGPLHGEAIGSFNFGLLMTNGKVLCVPCSSANIGLFNTSDNTYTRGPAHGEGSVAFSAAIQVSDTKVILIPFNSAYVGIYNPVTNTYTRGVAHGKGNNYAYYGGALLDNGKIMFCPSTSNNIGLYDPTNNTFVDGPTTEATSPNTAFMNCIKISSGKVILVPAYSAYVGIYDPVANSYTRSFAHGKTGGGYYSEAVMMPNSKLLFVTNVITTFGVYTYSAGSLSTIITDIARGDFIDGEVKQVNTGTSLTTFQLSYMPVANSAKIYFNGEKLLQGTNTTIDTNTKLLLNLNNNVTDSSNYVKTVTNNAVTFSNLLGYSDGPTTGTGYFCHCVMAPNGKIILVPINALNIGIYDPVANSYTSGPAHGKGYNAFTGGVLAPNGKIILVPHSSANIGIYDPIANTYTDGPAHGKSGAAVFLRGALSINGKVILIPCNSAYVGIYDPIANTYTDGPAHGKGGGAFMGGVPLSNGKIILCPLRSSTIGIYDPIANTYTNGPTHGQPGYTFSGGILANNGKVILTPADSTNVGIYDPVANTYTNGPAHGKSTTAFEGETLSNDGKVILIPYTSANIGIYDPIANTYTDGPAHGKPSGSFYGAVTLSNGKIIMTPSVTTYVGIYDPSIGSHLNGYFGSFNGTSSYLSVADSTDWAFGSGDFTIECWINFTNNGSETYIFNQYQDDNNFLSIYFGGASNPKSIGIGQVQTGNLIFNASRVWTPTLNTWYHVAFSRSGSTMHISINGSVTSTVIGNVTLSDLSGAVNIGRWGSGGKHFNGYMDDFRVSKGIARYTSDFVAPQLQLNKYIPSNDYIITNSTISLNNLVLTENDYIVSDYLKKLN